MPTKYVLLSTVVVPSFETATIWVKSLSPDEFIAKLPYVVKNYCGHPLTMEVLRQCAPNLPEAKKGQFWDGEGIALAARPKGGVRGAKGQVNGDTPVTLEDLEFCMFVWFV